MTTESDFERSRREYEDSILENRLRHFIEHWGPEGDRDQVRFQAELMMIVRQIYHEAQAPLIKAMSHMVSMPPLVMRGADGHVVVVEPGARGPGMGGGGSLAQAGQTIMGSGGGAGGGYGGRGGAGGR